MTKIPKAALSLKQFMLRQEVLKLYKEIWRTTRLVPDIHSRRELREWARHDFNVNRNQDDEVAIKMLLQSGRRSLSELQTSLELSGVSVKGGDK